LRRQPERNAVTIDDVFDFIREAGKQVDRLWVSRFVKRNNNESVVYKTVLVQKERREMSADDLEHYFETVGLHLKDVPSLFAWNADETRSGSPKRQRPSHVIVAKNIPPETTAVASVHDDA
jgi:hypothetical protein